MKQRIQHLLQLYAANQASREEVEELFAWLKKQEGDDELKKFIFDAADKEMHNTTLHQSDWDRIWRSVESATKAHAPAKIVRPSWPSRVLRLTAAALVLVMAGWAWFYLSRSKATSVPVVSAVTIKKDIPPGSNKALLTLGDGTTIVLDTVQTGLLALQGQTSIIKQNTGQLIYNSRSTAQPKAGDVLYNRVTTPRGGQFQLVLPDGTKVWLNAGSSLRFPASFSTRERRVQLTGEAYFEVAHNAKKPFIVNVNNKEEVTVLGTHFNVNAYDNEEAIKTTLLEGRVRVGSGEKAEGRGQRAEKEQSVVLKPGEQVSLSRTSPARPDGRSGGQLSQPIPVQTAGVIAWKNGYFRFKETGIRELMRQVERWYNVDVEYRTDRTDQYYTGVVSRSQNISALLKTLELTGTVHFQIDNYGTDGKKGKIIVLP
ncbi:MAG TPA: FecR domain-containing protein [Niastella sp.]